MPISNYIPNSRISQAGVIPNAAARPASPYEGQMLYQLDTNQLLVWDGTIWAAPNSTTSNPPGLELVTSSTVSGLGTTPTQFLNLFNHSNYKNYRLIVKTTAASVTNKLLFRFLANTTPSTSLYYGGGIGGDNGSATTVYFERSNNASALSITISTGATTQISTFDIIGPNVAQPTMYSGYYTERNNATAFTWGGNHLVDTAYNGFDIATSTGTRTIELELYGYRI